MYLLAMNTKRNFQPAEPIDDALVPMHERIEYQAKLAPLQVLEARLAEAEQTKQKAMARNRGVKAKRSVTERAAALVRGGKIDTSDPNAVIEACDEEIGILRAAIIVAHAELDEVSRDLSYEAEQRDAAEFSGAMRGALKAMYDLHAAFRQIDEMAARRIRAGYRVLSHMSGDLLPQAVVTLGDPDAVASSEAWRFKRRLTERGIV
jgi:hypothetical protein